jgi:osmoprotectant transport system ATP-binding protein
MVVESRDPGLIGTSTGDEGSRQRQTALLGVVEVAPSARRKREHRVADDPLPPDLVGVRTVEDEQREIDAYLVGREANAISRPHGGDHVGDHTSELAAVLGNRPAGPVQHRITPSHDGPHGAIRGQNRHRDLRRQPPGGGPSTGDFWRAGRDHPRVLTAHNCPYARQGADLSPRLRTIMGDRGDKDRQGVVLIEFESVSKRYDDGTVAVDDLSLTAANGEITVLVGPSGCGKTTSLRMINRTIEVTSGRILVDGDDIRSVNAVKLRRGIGYVIQQAGLFPHRTVLDNVTTVPRLLGVDRREANQRGMELLERVGLDPHLARRYPVQLSGGQQQRVGVARALAADPPIMLMDEPFSAVDPVVRMSLQDEFLRLQQDLGKTIVFVTHDIDEAVKLGDKVAVLEVGGRLAQFDSPADLLSNPVDEFVEQFIGRDRGYRALGFLPASELPLRPLNATPIGPDTKTFPHSGSLRAALDAALTSSDGQAFALDDSGQAVGVISQSDISAFIVTKHADV